jgi:hypothetical protein
VKGIPREAAEKIVSAGHTGNETLSTRSFNTPTCAFSPRLNVKTFFMLHLIFFKRAQRLLSGVVQRVRSTRSLGPATRHPE